MMLAKKKLRLMREYFYRMWIRAALLLTVVVVCSSRQRFKRQIPYPTEIPLLRAQGRSPQGFRASPLDQDAHEDIDRNSVQPSPFYPRLQQVIQISLNDVRILF